MVLWCYNETVRAGLCTLTASSSPQSSEASHFVLISGEPIREPVVQYGEPKKKSSNITLLT